MEDDDGSTETLVSYYERDVSDEFCEISENVLGLAAGIGILPGNSNKDEFLDEDVELLNEFINIWKLMENEKKALYNAKLLIQQEEFALENNEILNPTTYMKRLEMLEEFNNHFTIIKRETGKLRNRLQSPLLSEAINIHYSYQNNVLLFFELISSHFKKFKHHLDTLHKGVDLNYEDLKNDCGELLEGFKKKIAELQMTLHSLLTFRSTLNTLQKLKAHEFIKSNVSNTVL
ncbi:uncharacterized protein LOC111633040 isoform X1 [Centruroides sculpturatus]|uniref:uncharacterized protein LOC111633040 isoform X1 n=1 Tax=Centruroides sculpturatus TaxID=218467 RepID=UPI000C6CFCFA|nr:uncharacterized protein LOC111633040 isoform X1 [Centruroides sculpturatus]